MESSSRVLPMKYTIYKVIDADNNSIYQSVDSRMKTRLRANQVLESKKR